MSSMGSVHKKNPRPVFLRNGCPSSHSTGSVCDCLSAPQDSSRICAACIGLRTKNNEANENVHSFVGLHFRFEGVLLRGDHSKQGQILFVKMWKHTGFCVYLRS